MEEQRLDWPYLRVGRKLGRTIYGMESDEVSDDDVLIGIMDTPELAEMVVDAYNAQKSEPSCQHREYVDGRCADMACWNYVEKHRAR